MEQKTLLDTRKKLNELASQHNKLTTLVGCLLNELTSVRKELNEMKGIKTISTPNTSSTSSINQQQNNRMNQQQNMRQTQSNGGLRYDANNFASLRADEILQQLQINQN